jgi:hypothetical protein
MTDRVCKECAKRLTWAETRRQYGRLRQRGYSHEQSAARGTSCQKCTTAFVRNATAPIYTKARKSG